MQYYLSKMVNGALQSEILDTEDSQIVNASQEFSPFLNRPIEEALKCARRHGYDVRVRLGHGMKWTQMDLSRL